MALMQIQSHGLGCLHLPFQIAQKAMSKSLLSPKFYVNELHNKAVSYTHLTLPTSNSV